MIRRLCRPMPRRKDQSHRQPTQHESGGDGRNGWPPLQTGSRSVKSNGDRDLLDDVLMPRTEIVKCVSELDVLDLKLIECTSRIGVRCEFRFHGGALFIVELTIQMGVQLAIKRITLERILVQCSFTLRQSLSPNGSGFRESGIHGGHFPIALPVVVEHYHDVSVNLRMGTNFTQ